MAVYGYARVSTTDQDLTVQQDALKASGCEIIRSEKVSGSSRQGRDELKTLLEFVRTGDVLCVVRLDRLGRSIKDLFDIVAELEERGVGLRVIEQPVDTTTASGRAFLGMLSVFSEFETNLRRERQLEGIAKAKERGVYKGRKPSIDANQVRRLKSAGMGASQIANEMGCGRASVYRLLSS